MRFRCMFPTITGVTFELIGSFENPMLCSRSERAML